MNRLLVATSVYVALNASGLFVLRRAMNDGDDAALVATLLRPIALCGIALYGASFLVFMASLRHYPLTLVFPVFAGAGYVAVVLGGWLLFSEPISAGRVLGVVLVGIGIVLLQGQR